MPSSRRWSVSDGRTFGSIVLGVIGVFTLCAATGAGSWVMGALGVALLAAGIGLYVVSALNSREFAYVPGTANVQSCSPPPASASHGRCEMHLIVHAPGMDDVAVKIRDTGVPVSKWPHEGATLPILVALGDRRRVRVLWDDIRSHGEAAKRVIDGYEDETEEDTYLGDLLDEGYDEEPVPDLDPTARVIEMDLTYDGVPVDVPGDQESAGIDLSPGIDEAPSVDYSPAAGEAGAGAPGTATVAEEAPPLPRRKPSPRPRRATHDELHEPEPGGVLTAPRPPEATAAQQDPASAAQSMPLAITAGPREATTDPDAPDLILDVTALDFGAPAAPPAEHEAPDGSGTLRVEQVLTPEEGVPAMPSSSVVGDLSEEGTISEAYRAVTPPPGEPSPGRVRDVGVTLFVANLGRSVAFYRDLLGFVQVDIGRDSAVLESGDGRIVLRRVVDMAPVDRRLVHLMLEVPDVLVAYEELRAKGIEFVHRPRAVSRYEQLELWSAAFRDPDGHGIALIRWDLHR